MAADGRERRGTGPAWPVWDPLHARERAFRRLVVRAGLLPAAVLAAASVALLSLVLYLRSLNAWVDRTDFALARLHRLERLHVDLETGLRGFLLDADELLLEPWHAASSEIEPLEDELQALLEQQPEQAVRLQRLRAEGHRWQAWARDQLEKRRGGASIAEVSAAARTGKAVMDRVRGTMTELVQEEERQRGDRLRRADRVTRIALGLGLSSTVLLAVLVGLLAARQMRRAQAIFRDALRTQKRTEDQLRESDRRKTEFLGVLSHELRNPLAPIRNALHVLERVQPGTESDRRARAVIRRQADHLARLVDDLLDVTRISRGKIELHRQVVDVVEVVCRTAEDHRGLFEERGIALACAAGGPVWADADPTRLAQVVGNLLQNAAKFTPRGGSVTLRAEHAPGASPGDPGTAVVTVQDDGVGMAAGDLERLFEPFAQADTSLARTQGGLGLGLALVRGLVELHGGRVEARSDGAGKGTTFSFSLPGAAAPAAAPARVGGAPAVPGRSVLIIEDNEDAARTLAEVLELAGHAVHVVHAGADGIARARALKPDVVICDIGLPDLSGYDVARALKAEPGLEGTRLIALTGYALSEDRARAEEAGFDAHLPKPAPLDRLAELVGGPPLPGVRVAAQPR